MHSWFERVTSVAHDFLDCQEKILLFDVCCPKAVQGDNCAEKATRCVVLTNRNVLKRILMHIIVESLQKIFLTVYICI